MSFRIKPIEKYLYFWVLIGTILFPIHTYAQKTTSSFQHYSIENGLSDNTVNCIVQDNDGYIWIGTENGLNKYNGYTSKKFQLYQIDSLLEGSNRVECAFLDSRGRLWFGSKGLILCYPSEEKFKVFQHDQTQESIAHNDVFVISEDENKTIWIGTRLGLARFNESTHTFTRFLHDTVGTKNEIHGRNRIIDMVADQRGNLWMTTLMGFYKFSLADFSFKEFLLDKKNRNSNFANHFGFLAMDKKGVMWLNHHNKGLLRFDTLLNQFIPLQIGNPEIQTATKQIDCILSTTKGDIWIASSFNGLIQYNQNQQEWKHYTHDVFNAKSISDNKTQTLFEDRSGILWIGTASRGVERLSTIPEKFCNYILQPGKLNSLCENDITSVCEDNKNNLWIGSKSGLMYFNRSLNFFQCYKNDKKNKNTISDNCVNAISVDSHNNIWVATNDGLNQYSPSKDKWSHYKYNENDINAIPGKIVFDVIVRKNKEIWAATNGMVCKFKPESGNFETRYNNNSIDKLRHAFYCTIFEDSRKTLWISTTRSGIMNINDSFQVLHSYHKSGGFKANTVRQFAEDSNGNIWMASDQGLYCWNRPLQQMKRLGVQYENLSGDIKSIVIAGGNNIWISTNKGITQLNINNNIEIESTKNFTFHDGLQSNAFNVFAGTRLASGEIFFGGINGFNILNPQAILYNKYIPPAKISSFKIFDKELAFSSYNGQNTHIKLNHRENFFSFEMASLSFDYPEKSQFAYQLEGFDREMKYNGTHRFAYYTNVPPGKYVLHVICSNNDDLWNLEGTRIPIQILPPYWKTLWFRLLLISLILLATYTIYFIRVKKIRSQEKYKSQINSQMAEAKMTALRAQMNPHFIFNTLNSIQHLISESEKEMSLNYLSKFSKLIRLVLQNASANKNSIAVELKMLEYYLELEALRFVNKFTYHFSIDENINRENTDIPSLLLQPYIENAVIHGLLNKEDTGHLEVTMDKRGNFISCRIEDNGIGREASEKINQAKLTHHDPLGMKVTEDRILLIEKISNLKVKIQIEDLMDNHGRSSGTRVTIDIPIEEDI